MSVLSVNEHHTGRGGVATIDGNIEYTRQFIVITDTVNTSPETIRITTGIPALQDAYPSNTRAICHSVDAKPYGDQRKVWMVEVKYSTSARPPSADINWIRKPWNRKPQLKWGTYAVTEAVLKDRDGYVIQNSAGDRFDPSLTVEWHYPTLSINRYERNYDVNRALDYVDTVNELTVLVAGLIARAEGALLSKFEGANVEIDGLECWQVNYEIVFAPTFVKKILDQGFYAYKDGKKQIMKLKGKATTEPLLLDGVGKELAFGGTPVFKDFHVYKKKDFGPLGLP
jgi:hypothetical protein